MNTAFQRLCYLLVILNITACSMAELTVRASMPMIEGGMLALNRENDLLLAEAAMPANIELMEGMLINSPDNKDLRNYAAQAYYGYAYGFIEDNNKQRAAKFYYRGLKHAHYNLQNSGINKNILSGNLTTLQEKINTLDSDDIGALFWAASNWAKWIELNKDKTSAIADLPRAVMLMQRVLELDESYFMAGPHLFFAVYYGGRSPMLGGNYALSEKHFNLARKINKQQLLLVDLLQAEYLDRQQFKQSDFHQRLTDILNKKTHSIDMNLINQIARRKSQILLTKESLWF